MCTAIRFANASGNLFFGRNLDWVESFGEGILATPRSFSYEYAFGAEHREKPLAVLGVGAIMGGRPMYFDCANERGLAVAGLNFPGYAAFPHQPSQGKCNVATYEFPLWVARNFDSADSVETALRNVELVSRTVPGQAESLLHWTVSDASRCIVVESTADGIHVYENRIGVLANQPEFPWHVENLRNYMCATSSMPQPATWGAQELTAWGAGVGMHGIPGDVSSPSRFVRAAYTNANYPVQDSEEDNVARLFHTLANVQMVEGCAKVADGRFEKTLFTSGFSAGSNTYYASTYGNPQVRAFPMEGFDMDGARLQTEGLY